MTDLRPCPFCGEELAALKSENVNLSKKVTDYGKEDAMRTGRKRTKKYLELYVWIVQYKAKHNGNSPTIREMMTGMEISSTSVVHYMLRRLEEDGWVQRTPAGLVVSGGEWRMTDEPDALQARIAELEAVTRWIPVTERLPENGQECEVIDPAGYIHNWVHTDQLLNILAQYTHWRPLTLPQPPKPEEPRP